MLISKLGKKKKKSWMHFTSLNEVYPKDSFSVSRFDQIMDATVGHKLLNFMDVYLKYNQISMFL